MYKKYAIIILQNKTRYVSSILGMYQYLVIHDLYMRYIKIQCYFLQAFGTESGHVEIHKLKANFYHSKEENYLQELNTFMRYVAIL